MRDIILGGLLLPLRLYFQPTSFASKIAALAPNLPRESSLLEARHKFRAASLRRSLRRIIFQAVVALLWVPVLVGFSLIGYSVDWKNVAVCGVRVAFGVAFGCLVRGSRRGG